MAMAHSAAFLYSTTDLPLGDSRAPEASIASSGHQGPAWLHEAPAPSAGPQIEQFGRSEAEAKLLRFGLDPRTTVASCEAIRGRDPGNLELALPARPRCPWSLTVVADLAFVGAEGPKSGSINDRTTPWVVTGCRGRASSKILAGTLTDNSSNRGGLIRGTIVIIS